MSKRKISITIVPKEVGELLDQLVQKMLSQIVEPPLQCKNIIMTEAIKNQYNEDYDVHQGTCYQQYSPNLCGYHAIFNTFCFLKMFNGGTCEYNINSGASFWRFKLKIQSFLTKYKMKYHKPEQWPWRKKDIQTGDFQRTHNKICMEEFDQFKIFRKHENFYYLTETWQFQYQNLLGTQAKLNDLQNMFAQFRFYQGQKPLVLHLMLAITTHWLTFIAIKNNGHSQFWFFDSFNNKYLNFSWEEIMQFVEMKSQDRVKYNKPQFTPFQKQSYSMCMKDIQTSLKLIIGCLKGEESLQRYVYNRQFNIFADRLQQEMQISHTKASNVIRDYQHNIRTFFSRQIRWQLFSSSNHQRMKEFITYSKEIQKVSQQGKYFHSLLKTYRI